MQSTAVRSRTNTHPAAQGFLARYSGDSRKTYTAALARYLAWCESVDVDPLQASRADVEIYRVHLLEHEHLKPSTVYGYLSVLSAFYRVAVADEWVEHDPMPLVRRPRVYYDDNRLAGLSRHDLEKLILHADQRSPQHAALVILLGVLGLRVSEAARVRIEDFAGYERGHRVLRLIGKGGKPATMPLPPLVFRVLDKAAGDRDFGPLLTTRTGRQLSRNDAYRWIDTLGRQCGLGHIHPHQLRHAAVTAALDAGADLRDVQTFGRWSDARMVERYDRNRHNLDRHAVYKLGAHLSGIADRIAA
ncbi:site-specific recombinase XerD [Microbacterium trichothecenolyticum]|uniref:tyrosine-type recombinase/integrase n=1 Tax=Microbacterium trichothecenolyticum TaxID=69370 RepID=UPI0028557D2A|nr:tyrosine-type recombinase/integrase [Microbacterium trichothecenolyticum]MDR7113870.1 site-specific recombinase XerD [Microbacterium trichothecenolyticum]